MKKKNNYLNVFNQHFYPWRHLSNWIPNFKMFFRSFKYAYQRITKGFSTQDCWDIDTYLLHLLPDLLRRFQLDNNGYPERVGSFEEWDKILNEMIEHFDKARIYYDILDVDDVEVPKLGTKTKEHIKKGFELLTEYFSDLWW